MRVLVTLLAIVGIVLAEDIHEREKRQITFEDFVNGLMQVMPLGACFQCPWVPSFQDCCSFQPLDSLSEREIRSCPSGLIWNETVCNCDYPAKTDDPNDFSVCKPNRDCVTTDPTLTTTPAPTCPPNLNDSQCCLPRVGQWFQKENETHYRINGGIIQPCPNGMTFDASDCCCEGLAVIPNPCKHWTFDRPVGEEFVDVRQQTWGQSVRAEIGLGVDDQNKGLHLRPLTRMSIPFFSGAHLGNAFSLAFWIKTSADNAGSAIISNGNRFNEPTILLVQFGNSIAGGLATDKEDPSDALDLPLTDLGGDGWHFVAMVYKGPMLTFYLDDQPPITYRNGGKIKSNFCQLTIGGVLFPEVNIDEIAICDFDWTEDQVTEFRTTKVLPTDIQF